jgi:predicted transcriptional regulator
MNEFAKYMDEVKQKVGIPSDRQLAMKLGEKQQNVSRYRTGETTAPVDFCEKLAELAGDEAAKVLMIAQMSKASEKTINSIRKILKCVAAATFVLLFTAITAHASTTPSSQQSPTVYIMLNRFFRKIKKLAKKQQKHSFLILQTA